MCVTLLGHGMVKCARCGRDVDELRVITPDVITRGLTDSLDDSEGTLADEGELRVCAECMGELKGE